MYVQQLIFSDLYILNKKRNKDLTKLDSTIDYDNVLYC